MPRSTWRTTVPRRPSALTAPKRMDSGRGEGKRRIELQWRVRAGAGQLHPSSERRHHFALRVHHNVPDGVFARCRAWLFDVGRDVQPVLSALDVPPAEGRDAQRHARDRDRQRHRVAEHFIGGARPIDRRRGNDRAVRSGLDSRRRTSTSTRCRSGSPGRRSTATTYRADSSDDSRSKMPSPVPPTARTKAHQSEIGDGFEAGQLELAILQRQR